MVWLVKDIVYSCFVTLTVLLLIAFSATSFAQVRSSSNYQLQSDSINSGGGLGNSASFYQESTVGEIATGQSDSASFSLRAGYQQMQEVYLSLTPATDVIMTPDLPGLTGGTSNGSTTFTVVTDSPSGYRVTLEAENDPAMQRADGASIGNYNNGNTADFAFTIPTASAVFGFSPEGVDVVDTFLDNTVSCGVGATETAGACWMGASTTPVAIAESGGSNQPVGATTTIEFRVGLANGANIESGVYVATTTITALPL